MSPHGWPAERVFMEEQYRWFVGIDWAAEFHEVCVLDAQRKVVEQRKVEHSGQGIAQLLWRVFGHHANGQRIRLIGSSLFTVALSGEFGCDETVLDQAAMAAQINRPLLDYSA